MAVVSRDRWLIISLKLAVFEPTKARTCSDLWPKLVLLLLWSPAPPEQDTSHTEKESREQKKRDIHQLSSFVWVLLHLLNTSTFNNIPMTFLLLTLDSPKLWTLKAQIFREVVTFNTNNPITSSRTGVLIFAKDYHCVSKREFGKILFVILWNMYENLFVHLHSQHLLCSLLPAVAVLPGDWLQSSKDPSLQWPVVYLGNMQVNVGERSVWWMCCVSACWEWSFIWNS